MLLRRFPVDVYHRYLTLLYGTRGEIDRQMQREMARIKLPSTAYTVLEKQNTGRFCVYQKDGYRREYIMIVDPKDGHHDVVATLAHEVLHFVFYTLDNAGVKLSEDSEEAYTYYFTYVLNECLAVLPVQRRRR